MLPENHKKHQWHWLFLDTMSENKHSIARYIRLLNLNSVSSYEELQNNIYLTLYNLCKTEKLIFNPDTQVFTYVKKDGSKTQISNFKAWCKSISFNYLKQLRKERNKIENQINIDDEHFPYQVATKSTINNLEFTEIKEKIQLLSDLDRRIIEMAFFDGYKFEEISIQLQKEGFGGIEPVTLRMRKSRALRKLRKLFLSNNQS